jgi:hypothetical protein
VHRGIERPTTVDPCYFVCAGSSLDANVRAGTREGPLSSEQRVHHASEQSIEVTQSHGTAVEVGKAGQTSGRGHHDVVCIQSGA